MSSAGGPEVAHGEVTQRVRTGTEASGLPGPRPLYLAHRSCLPSESQHGEGSTQKCEVMGRARETVLGQGGPWESLSLLPWLSPQGSGHNVSQEALAIKRMLEIGAVKNLTYF